MPVENTPPLENDRLEFDHSESDTFHKILGSKSEDIVAVANEAGFDMETFFSFGHWQKVNFSGSDVLGISFQGSDISGACFRVEQLNAVIASKPRYAKNLVLNYSDVSSSLVDQSIILKSDYIFNIDGNGNLIIMDQFRQRVSISTSVNLVMRFMIAISNARIDMDKLESLLEAEVRFENTSNQYTKRHLLDFIDNCTKSFGPSFLKLRGRDVFLDNKRFVVVLEDAMSIESLSSVWALGSKMKKLYLISWFSKLKSRKKTKYSWTLRQNK